MPRRDLSVSVARQLLAFADPRIRPRLEAVWGKVQPTSKTQGRPGRQSTSRCSLPPRTQPADPARGRAVFNRTCLSCHKLFDAGGDVGPELTGSDRANPDYILENVLDPSAAVSRDYTLTNVATTDGRLISGIIREQTPTSLVIQTANERVVVARDDVEAIKPSTTSMMPEGLLDPLSTQRGPRPVRVPRFDQAGTRFAHWKGLRWPLADYHRPDRKPPGFPNYRRVDKGPTPGNFAESTGLSDFSSRAASAYLLAFASLSAGSYRIYAVRL